MIKNVLVDYEKITNIIYGNFYKIINNNENYKNLKLFVDTEEQFLKREHIEDENALFIVVKYGEATINYGSCVLPINLIVFGLANNIEKTLNLLNEYTTAFNLNINGDIQQLYNTPRGISNFGEANNDFRSLFTLSGIILIGNEVVRLSSIVYHGETDENISVLSFDDDSTNILNPQPYADGDGRAKSYSTFQTYTFSITLYNSDLKLIKDVMSVKYGGLSSNTDFIFSFNFTNGIKVDKWKFKYKNAKLISKIGETPIVSLTFSL